MRSREGAMSYGILGAMGIRPVAVEGGASLSTPRARVDGVLVWAPCAGAVSMSASIFSYARETGVGFLVDAGLVPDPDELVSALEEELAQLASAGFGGLLLGGCANPRAHVG